MLLFTRPVSVGFHWCTGIGGCFGSLGCDGHVSEFLRLRGGMDNWLGGRMRMRIFCVRIRANIGTTLLLHSYYDLIG